MEATLRRIIVRELAQSLLLAAGAFGLTLLTGHYWIRWLRHKKIGKQVRADGPPTHLVKTGTPTMGGIMIVTSVLVITVLFNLVDRFSMLLPLGVVVAFTVIGIYDDFLSLTGTRSATHGLTVRLKLLILLGSSFAAALALYLPKPFGLANNGCVQIPFVGAINLPAYIYLPLAMLVILATSNAVNITDGADGLAGWTLLAAFTAYGIITAVSYPRLVYLQVFCFTVVGATMAFLWFNVHPAQVIMGDAGALPLGAVLGVVALISQHWLLLPLIGMVFVMNAGSSMLQVAYFKWTRRRSGTGRRLFKIAPVLHHFELSGWSEQQVMQRMVVLGIIAATVGIALSLTTPAARGVPQAQPGACDAVALQGSRLHG